MSNPLQPTFHKPVPMGSRVILPEAWAGKSATGTVVGIASATVLFGYIGLLDSPIVSEYGEQKAVVCSGCELKSLEGENWQFASYEDRDQYLASANKANDL